MTGLAASGLVLQDNGADSLAVASGATTFTFPTTIASGGTYAVTIQTQPTGEMCTLANASGTASANVTNVGISCTSNAFQVGVTVSGLAGAGLVLQDNGGDNLSIATNGTLTFATPITGGGAYAVTVLTQPANQTCTVVSPSGTATANVNLTVTCVTSAFTVGGSITGLTSAGLVLTNNSGDSLMIPANATSFQFATSEATGAAYAVAVGTQPGSPKEFCTVTGGAGSVAAANVATVAISCHPYGRFLYVANATDGPSSFGDVSAFTINGTDGSLTAVSAAAYSADKKPSGIVLDPTGQFAYVTNKTTADVSVFSVDWESGALSLLNNTKSKNTFGTSIAMTPDGTHLFVGGTGNPNTTSALFGFTRDVSTGLLTADADSPYGASNTPYGLAVDPSNTFLFATAIQLHNLHSYTIGAGPLLTETANSPVNTGSQPYGVVVGTSSNASGGFVYVAEEGLGRVGAFSYDSTGTLTELTNRGSPWPTGLQPSGMALDPTGKYLYVANYGDGSVSSFSVGTNGSLTPMQVSNNAVSTGNLSNVANPGPIDVKVDPTAPFVYVANYLDSSVSVFSVSQGQLTLVQTYPVGDGPTALVID